MVKGRLDAKASTATGYCWIVWQCNVYSEPKLVWIPPCRRNLEKPGGYSEPMNSTVKEISAARYHWDKDDLLV